MKDIASILSKVDAEGMLTKEDAVTLLNIDNQSKVFYELIAKANETFQKRVWRQRIHFRADWIKQ